MANKSYTQQGKDKLNKLNEETPQGNTNLLYVILGVCLLLGAVALLGFLIHLNVDIWSGGW